jgi:hypothetical protein
MRTRIVLLLTTLLVHEVFAQDEIPQTSKARYFNSFLSGGLFGEKDKVTSFTFSTTHGIVLNDLRLGAGLGYDSYQQWRIMPLFASISYDFAEIKQNNFFLMVAPGYAVSSYRSLQYFESNFDGGRGWMLSSALGYRFSAAKWSIIMSLGYKWQRLEYTYASGFYYNPSGQPNLTSVEEQLKRVVVQIGFGFN